METQKDMKREVDAIMKSIPSVLAQFHKSIEDFKRDGKMMKGGSITDTYDVEYFNPAHKQAYNTIMNAYLTHRDKKQKKAGSDYYKDLERREKVYKEKTKKKRGRPRKIKGRGVDDEIEDNDESNTETEASDNEGIGSLELQQKNQQLGNTVNKSISDYYSSLMSNTAMNGIRK